MMTYLRLAWRHARRRPLQSLFFVLGVAIGVAMIVAIDQPAARPYAVGHPETVTAKTTHQIISDWCRWIDLYRYVPGWAIG
ncbi:MAG: hypothetical protein R2867_19950 [Caldilineaceae bacterium]